MHTYDCYQNVTEPQTTEYHTKSTHVYNTGTVSQAKACCTQAGPAHTTSHMEMAWIDESTLASFINMRCW